MIEKIKGINNPHTIIAIFAALAEVSATVSLGLIDKTLQPIFIWFLIGFPSLLVILFFITLNFNTKVMYSPSDYQDEKYFVKALFPNKVSDDLDNLNIKVKTIIDGIEHEKISDKNYEELKQIPDDIEKIKEKSQQIPINNAWDVNHWRSNYASIEGDKIAFTGISPQYKEDGCNIDLLDFLEVGKIYEISCFAKSISHTTGKFKLWCHDKTGEPNGISKDTNFKVPPENGERFKLIFKAVYNRNIRVHLQYLPGEGKIEVDDIRIKEII